MIPDVNISIDNPVAVVDKTLTSTALEVAERLSIFFTQTQREFAKVGFRPVDPMAEEVAKQYTKIKTLFTAQDLGGWDSIQTKFFEDGRFLTKFSRATHENTRAQEPI